jgi:C-terminal processing protease CtpA/Prc
MKIKVLNLFWWLCAGFAWFAVSCGEEYGRVDEIVPPEEETEVTKVNKFVNEDMQSYYLWSTTVDWSKVYPEKETDAFAFFEKLKYVDDKWSMLTDDIDALQGEFDGNVTSFGYTLIFGQFSNSEDLFAIVLYVYPDTPADRAGLKRGDFIVGINGGYITRENRMELYDAPDLILTRGILTDAGIATDPALIFMSAEQVYENPILEDTVIVKGSHKIGYLSYADYTQVSEGDLQRVFTGFKSQGVTDVVLDLRYNGGGYVRTMSVLTSILAPAQAVKSKQIYLRQIWNPTIEKYLKGQGEDLSERFTDTLSVNMNLNRLYVLTSEYSASASESTIVGLRPYLTLVQIGDTTHGKYCAGGLFQPQVQVKNGWVTDESISNWGMYLMIYRLANVTGDDSFLGGLPPDILAEEDYFPLYPWGDDRDPLLGRAIADITGIPYMDTRSGRALPSYTIRRDLKIDRARDGKMISEIGRAADR